MCPQWHVCMMPRETHMFSQAFARLRGTSEITPICEADRDNACRRRREISVTYIRRLQAVTKRQRYSLRIITNTSIRYYHH